MPFFSLKNVVFITHFIKRRWHSIGRGLTTCVTRQVLFYLDKKLNNTIFKTNSYERGCHTLTGNAKNNKAVNDNTVTFGFNLHFETQLEIKGLIHVIYVSSYNRIYQEFR